jgi:hypothetical protein
MYGAIEREQHIKTLLPEYIGGFLLVLVLGIQRIPR